MHFLHSLDCVLCYLKKLASSSRRPVTLYCTFTVCLKAMYAWSEERLFLPEYLYGMAQIPKSILNQTRFKVAEKPVTPHYFTGLSFLPMAPCKAALGRYWIVISLATTVMSLILQTLQPESQNRKAYCKNSAECGRLFVALKLRGKKHMIMRPISVQP